MSTDSKTKSVSRKLLVWDLPTRLFHWLLMLSIIGSWTTAEAGFDWTETHFLFGYFSLSLVIFRVTWGFVGPTHARFSAFIQRPTQTLLGVRQLFNRQPAKHVGHNPVGGLSVIVFLILVCLQATTGLFISDDIFYAGPYNGVISSATAGTLAQIHHLNFTVLQVFIVIHLLAITWYALGKRSNLVRPMVTGKKLLAEHQQQQSIASSQLLKAFVIAALTTMVIVSLVQLAPPPPVPDFF